MRSAGLFLFAFLLTGTVFGQICDPFVDDGGTSPIVVNFSSGDYVLTGNEAPVVFDIRADGQPLDIGWTAANADEAFLALDRNGNGAIDNGAELFGSATPLLNGDRARNGFLALLEFDDNHDGAITSADEIWSHLLLWRDQNHDGISQSWEITAVNGSALLRIDLAYHWSGKRDPHGNVFRFASQVWIAGKEAPVRRPVYDIFFVRLVQ